MDARTNAQTVLHSAYAVYDSTILHYTPLPHGTNPALRSQPSSFCVFCPTACHRSFANALRSTPWHHYTQACVRTHALYSGRATTSAAAHTDQVHNDTMACNVVVQRRAHDCLDRCRCVRDGKATTTTTMTARSGDRAGGRRAAATDAGGELHVCMHRGRVMTLKSGIMCIRCLFTCCMAAVRKSTTFDDVCLPPLEQC